MIEICRNLRGWLGILVPLLLVLSFGPHQVNATASVEKSRNDQEYESRSNKYVLMKYLVPVLNQNGQGARVYYATDCPADLGSPYYPYPFPYTNAQPPSGGLSGFAAVHEILKADKNVEVSENSPGVIDIVIGKPSTEILKTHITEIKLEAEEHYDPIFTIDAIRNAAEVQTAATKLGIHLNEIRGRGYLPMSHKQGDPFLPGPLKNLTLHQALGVVAKELKVIVLYGTCTKQKFVSLGSIGGPGFHLSGLLP